MAAVYPRACGGTITGRVDDESLFGLSPRVRAATAATELLIAGTKCLS